MARIKGATGAKADRQRLCLEEQIKAKGWQTPLDYLLSVMNNKKHKAELRIDAAHKCMSYVHKRQPVALHTRTDIHVPLPYIPSKSEWLDMALSEDNDS